jgi:hypothetical protein
MKMAASLPNHKADIATVFGWSAAVFWQKEKYQRGMGRGIEPLLITNYSNSEIIVCLLFMSMYECVCVASLPRVEWK